MLTVQRYKGVVSVKQEQKDLKMNKFEILAVKNKVTKTIKTTLNKFSTATLDTFEETGLMIWKIALKRFKIRE
jgi:hypothetical protein